MTQLFETNTYDASDEQATAPRHLRSIPTDRELANRTVQWQLDENTIEAARRGIALARQALKESVKDTEKPKRKAA